MLDSTILPESVISACPNVVTVTPHVLKKVSGLDNVDATHAAAELQLPPTVRSHAQAMLGASTAGDTSATCSKPLLWCSLQSTVWLRLALCPVQVDSRGRCIVVSHNTSAASSTAYIVQDLLQSPPAQLQRLLVLQGVQEPGNVGALIRSAAALGWDAVCLDAGCSDPFSEKAIRASRGASLRVRIAVAYSRAMLDAGKPTRAAYSWHSLCRCMPVSSLRGMHTYMQLSPLRRAVLCWGCCCQSCCIMCCRYNLVWQGGLRSGLSLKTAA